MLGHYSPVKAEKTPGPGSYIRDFSWTKNIKSVSKSRCKEYLFRLKYK
jgi:hypothetical protein